MKYAKCNLLILNTKIINIHQTRESREILQAEREKNIKKKSKWNVSKSLKDVKF